MKKGLKQIVYIWKKFWWRILIFVLFFSIITLFITSFIFDQEITLSVMNEWVSLIVGLAALLLGIISLILSFYNLDQSTEMQRESLQIMNLVKNDIENKVIELKFEMNKQFEVIKREYRGTNISGIIVNENAHETEWDESNE